MNFDETLQHTFATLNARLRAELDNAVEQLNAATQAERERLTADADALADRAVHTRMSETAAEADARVQEADARLREAAERAREEGRADGYAEGFASGTDAERNSAARVPSVVASTRGSDGLLDAVRAIGAARSLSEVLDTLASTAGREAPRAAVVLVRGGRFRGWRFVGFPSRFDAADTVDVVEVNASVIADAARTGTPAADGAAPAFADLESGRSRLAIPIAMSGQVVAVLYADEGAQDAEKSELRSENLEVLARFAARCLEALTAFKAARVLLERPDLPGVHHAHGPAVDDSQDAGDPADADAAARRYARLLVSEIKLYHEPSVIAGRREGDLATRLRTEIARARVLYEQRVPDVLRQRTDYFQSELVRTLADGDAGLLEVKT